MDVWGQPVSSPVAAGRTSDVHDAHLRNLVAGAGKLETKSGRLQALGLRCETEATRDGQWDEYLTRVSMRSIAQQSFTVAKPMVAERLPYVFEDTRCSTTARSKV